MFGVFTFTLIHFLAKNIFPEGMEVYKILVDILEGWGTSYGKLGRGGLLYIPPVVGVWIFSATTHSLFYLTSHVSIESF